MSNIQNLKLGDIFLINSTRGTFLSKCIRFFTRMPYTHCAIYVGEICGEPSVLSAEALITIIPVKKYFDDESIEIEIYSITSDKIPYAINRIYNEYGGSIYGFMQLFWFIWRWILESFKVDTKSMKNWFPDGEVCSEMAYDEIWYTIGGPDYPLIARLLGQYNSNTVAPGDIVKIIKKIVQLFYSTTIPSPIVKTWERKISK